MDALGFLISHYAIYLLIALAIGIITGWLSYQPPAADKK